MREAILMVCFSCCILSLILALSASLGLQALARGDGSGFLQLDAIWSILVGAGRVSMTHGMTARAFSHDTLIRPKTFW